MTDDTATNPVAQAPEAAAPEVAQDDAERFADVEDLDASSEPPPPEGDDDEEEVEYEGKKFRGPKGVKDALLRQQDYTRKTQEVAEQRKALEARQAEITQQAAAQAEFFSEVAKVKAVDEQLQQYAQVNWDALAQQDPAQAQRLWFQYQQLKDARFSIAGSIEQKAQAKALERQQQLAKRIEEGQQALAREIKGWGPEMAGKLAEYGVSIGFSREEMNSVMDPRIVKALHRAYVGEQLISKQRAPTAPPSEQPKPAVPRVGSGGSPTHKDPAKMSMDEYAKWRRSGNG